MLLRDVEICDGMLLLRKANVVVKGGSVVELEQVAQDELIARLRRQLNLPADQERGSGTGAATASSSSRTTAAAARRNGTTTSATTGRQTSIQLPSPGKSPAKRGGASASSSRRGTTKASASTARDRPTRPTTTVEVDDLDDDFDAEFDDLPPMDIDDPPARGLFLGQDTSIDEDEEEAMREAMMAVDDARPSTSARKPPPPKAAPGPAATTVSAAKSAAAPPATTVRVPPKLKTLRPKDSNVVVIDDDDDDDDEEEVGAQPDTSISRRRPPPNTKPSATFPAPSRKTAASALKNTHARSRPVATQGTGGDDDPICID